MLLFMRMCTILDHCPKLKFKVPHNDIIIPIILKSACQCCHLLHLHCNIITSCIIRYSLRQSNFLKRRRSKIYRLFSNSKWADFPTFEKLFHYLRVCFKKIETGQYNFFLLIYLKPKVYIIHPESVSLDDYKRMQFYSHELIYATKEKKTKIDKYFFKSLLSFIS